MVLISNLYEISWKHTVMISSLKVYQSKTMEESRSAVKIIQKAN